LRFDSFFMSKNKVRIRFIDDPSSSWEVEVLSDDCLTEDTSAREVRKDDEPSRNSEASCSNDTNSCRSAEAAIKERNIFMRAALQMQEINSNLQNSLIEQQQLQHQLQQTLNTSGSSQSNLPSPILRSHNNPSVSKRYQFAVTEPVSSLSTSYNGLTGPIPKKSFDYSYDVIRIGILKKQPRGGPSLPSFGSSSGGIDSQWKMKYVELRHGLLTYFDHSDVPAYATDFGDSQGGGTMACSSIGPGITAATRNRHSFSNADNVNNTNTIGGNDLWGVNESIQSSKRTIVLPADTTVCQVFNAKAAAGYFIFELKTPNAPRRLWMASNAEECNEWIRNIRSALSPFTCAELSALSNNSNGNNNALNSSINSGISSNASNTSILNTSGSYSLNTSTMSSVNNTSNITTTAPERRLTQRLMDGLSTPAILGGSARDRTSIKSQHHVSNDRTAGEGQGVKNPHFSYNGQNRQSLFHYSSEGAAAPYVEEISRYLQIKNDISRMELASAYQSYLNELKFKRTTITIPAFFIKTAVTASLRESGELRIPHQQPQLTSPVASNTCKARTQLWKDLKRDVIVINNESVTGACEMGAENIVGALLRHITEKVERAKTLIAQPQESKNVHSMIYSHVLRSSSGAVNPTNSKSSAFATNKSCNNLTVISRSRSVDGENYIPTQSRIFPPVYNSKFSESGSDNEASCSNINTYLNDQQSVNINDAEVLSFALDILMMSNRTQSGGDSYFCVDSLFCENKKHLCILTPLSSESDPVKIKVDLVLARSAQQSTTPSTSSVYSTSSFESRTIKVSQLQQHQLSQPAAVNVTGRKTVNSFPIREASTFSNSQNTSPSRAYGLLGRTSSNTSNNEISKLQSPMAISVGSDNDNLSLLETREVYSPEFFSGDNSPYSTNNNTPFQDAVRNNFNAQCLLPSPNVPKNNQLTINTNARLALPENVISIDSMNTLDNDEGEMEDTLSDMYGHGSFSPTDGSPPLHVFSQPLKAPNNNKANGGTIHSNTTQSPNRRYVSENTATLSGGGQSKMIIHKQKSADTSNNGKIISPSKAGKQHSSTNNAPGLKGKHRKSSSMSAILLNENDSNESPFVSPTTVPVNSIYATNSSLRSRSRMSDSGHSNSISISNSSSNSRVSSSSSSDSIESSINNHSKQPQRRSSSGASHSRSNTPLNSPTLEDNFKPVRNISPQHPHKRHTKQGHRNSFSMSAAPAFDTASHLTPYQAIVSNVAAPNPTNNHRNQLNLVESLMTHGYQIQNSKDLINQANIQKSSTASKDLDFISSSRSTDFEKQSSPNKKSSKSGRNGIITTSDDTTETGVSNSHTTQADESSVVSEITFESNGHNQPGFKGHQTASLSDPESSSVSNSEKSGPPVGMRKLWAPPSMSKSKTLHLSYINRESSGESIEGSNSRTEETPLKSSHSQVKGKKKLKNFISNMFTPVKGNHASFDFTTVPVRHSIPTPHDDIKLQQNSVENIPHLLLSRLRGLGSSSVEATHFNTTSSNNITTTNTSHATNNRNRRNSDGDRNFYTHDNQSLQHTANDIDDDSTTSYGHHQTHKTNNHHPSKFNYFVRVEVSALSHYKICTADPQGDESMDNWAEVSGNFTQSFFFDLEACRLAMTDRLITIDLTDRHQS